MRKMAFDRRKPGDYTESKGGDAMKTLGLDIGTTNISAVVLADGQMAAAKTVANDSFLMAQSWERVQEPKTILQKCLVLVEELLHSHPDIAAIGLTGQMHGILYVDARGEAVSPLYTWQDGRGDQCRGEKTWAEELSQRTGYPLATGYGMVTHYYNVYHNLVPETARKLCTIQDYIAMKLSGGTAPVIDPTDGASLGLWDLQRGCFDRAALEKAGLDAAILPDVAEDPCLGKGALGIPVYAAIGDNQASFLGAAGGCTDVLLVNVGTGSQISVYSPEHLQLDTMETRPFPGGGWLLAGAALCGGRSYALLENFFRQTVKMVTGREENVYAAMTRALEAGGEAHNCPTTVTTFQGTRKDPALRGSITGLSAENFTPLHLMHSMMQGMARELYEMYRAVQERSGRKPELLIGSGNGLRRNPFLCRIFAETFGCPLVLSDREEEAACGAAELAAHYCGKEGSPA